MDKNHENGMSGMVLDETVVFTLAEISERCHVSQHVVIEMIEYGLVEPDKTQDEMRLDAFALQRIQSAARLQHDFDINMQGVAMILELMDELNDLHHELAVLRKHLE